MSPASDDRARVPFFAAGRRSFTRTAARVVFLRLVAIAPIETQPDTLTFCEAEIKSAF